MTEMWIDVVLPWPWWVCVAAAAVEILLLLATSPRWLRILRDPENRPGEASRRSIRRLLRVQGAILGVALLGVAALYGYDLGISQLESSLQGGEVASMRGTRAGLQCLVPFAVGLGLWGGLWMLKRASQ